MPHRIRPPLISRYKPGMAYGLHVDDALMGPVEARDRSDISVTVFVSDAKEYEGGELVIHSPYGKQEIKLPSGHLVAYPSSSLHEVTAVTSGERLVSVTWVQSYIRDEKQREALGDVAIIRNKLNALVPNSPETDLAFRLHTNLMRMWSDT
jgi:PKHD-type hydroxylase